MKTHNKIVKTPNIAHKLACLPGRLFCFSALFKASHYGGLFYGQYIAWKKINGEFLCQKAYVISSSELSREELELIVQTAGQLKAEPNPELIKNKLLPAASSNLQHELVSFETAIQRIGGDVIGFDSGGNTSLAKKAKR